MHLSYGKYTQYQLKQPWRGGTASSSHLLLRHGLVGHTFAWLFFLFGDGPSHFAPELILGFGRVDFVEVGEVYLLLNLPDLLFAIMFAPVQHSVHVEIHGLVQVGRVEVHLLLLFLCKLLVSLLCLGPCRLHYKPLLAVSVGLPQSGRAFPL